MTNEEARLALYRWTRRWLWGRKWNQIWWPSTMPGLVIVLAGVGFSLIGDGLADRLEQGFRGRAGENEGMILTVAEETQ